MKQTKIIAIVVLAATLSSCDEKKTPEIEPTALAGPTVTVGDITENSVVLSWDKVENSTGYEYKCQGPFNVVSEAKVDADIVTTTIGDLDPDTEYAFLIKAIGDGETHLDSDWKETRFFTTAHVPTYVEFADAVFKDFIFSMTPAVDTDNDGVISFEEAAAVKEINAGFEDKESATDDKTFTNLAGLQYFTSLETLNLKYHRVTNAAPVEGLSTLKSLNLGENPISTLDISKLVNLTDLRLYGTNISTLDLGKAPLITTLYLQRTALTDLDLTPLANLEEAAVNNAKLKTLKAVGLSKLTRLDAVANELSSVDIKDCGSLQQLHLNTNKLTSLDIKGLSKLIILNVYGNELTSVDLSGAPRLLMLFINDNKLESLKLSSNRLLSQLYASNNPLKKLDLGFNSNIAVLEAENMPSLEEINLQNDYCDDFAEYYIVKGNTALRTVIVDEGYEYDYVSGLFKNVPTVSVVTE